ncbi:MAG: ribulose-phosphate 3-epimerase [Clostridiales bacterium]|jgi:ribulose-phosphate 3-epimerase|nr:ribulose-phosphate 3-epimerase [Clostridiales bacterium]
MIKISPSLLAANITRLGEEIGKIEHCADMLHIDVMDGHFVPNLSFGVPVVAGIKKAAGLILDVHLMIDNPLRYIEKFSVAGADVITVHIEAPDDAEECIRLIRSLGKKAGIALNPDTPPQKIAHLAGKIDMALQMTVFPGFGGQSMERQAVDNIRVIREIIGADTDLQVDGGIYAENCAELTSRGANVIVSGTGIFGQPNPAAAVRVLRERAEEGAAL